MVFKNDDRSKAVLGRFSVVSKWNIVFISLPFKYCSGSYVQHN